MNKAKLENSNNLAGNLLFWIKQFMGQKVYTVKVKELSSIKRKSVGELNKDEVCKNILSAKDIEELKAHAFAAKKQGMYNLPDNLNPQYKFFNFVIGDKNLTGIKQINTDTVHSFVQVALAKNTPKTQEQYYDQVKSLFKFIENNNQEGHKFNIGLLRNGKKSTSPIDKSIVVEQTFLEPRELLGFLKKIKNLRFNHPNPLQTGMILKFACYGGLRKEELVKLDLDSYCLEKFGSETYMKLSIKGKGDKEREVYVLYSLIKKEFEIFLETRKEMQKKSNALFVTRLSTRYSPRSIEEMVFRAFINTGYGGRGLTVHSLRRSYATYLYSSGVNIEEIAKLLGHSAEEMTETYIYLSQQKKYEVVDLLESV